MLRRRFFSIIIALILCFSAVIVSTGCSSDKRFTVVFMGGAEDAELYYGEQTQVVSSSQQLVEPIYIRPGYNFVGWNKSISKITGDTTVNAQWRKYSFEVVFHANGGQDENGNKMISVQTDSAYDLILRQPKFTKVGYDLSWSIDLNTVTASCSIQAIWTPKILTLTFKDDNGNDFKNNKMTISYNQTLEEISVVPPKKEGKKFAYWANGLDSNALPLDKGIVWREETGETLYPHYVDDDEFVITYDLDGGEREEKIYAYDQYNDLNSSILSDPERDGYNFKGWLINDQTEPKSSSDIKVKDFLIDGQYADVKLKATWSSEPYIIDFDTLGGTLFGEKTIKVNYGQAIGKLPSAQKDNYEFVGWYYDGKEIDENTVWNYSKKGTLTARYKAIYKVKFSLSSIIGADNEQLQCRLIKWGSVPDSGTVDFEDVWFEIKEGESLFSTYQFEKMPVVDPIESEGINEYVFGNYWQWIDSSGNAYKVYNSTILNSTNFPNVLGGETITLIPYCKLVWSPLY